MKFSFHFSEWWYTTFAYLWCDQANSVQSRAHSNCSTCLICWEWPWSSFVLPSYLFHSKSLYISIDHMASMRYKDFSAWLEQFVWAWSYQDPSMSPHEHKRTNKQAFNFHSTSWLYNPFARLHVAENLIEIRYVGSDILAVELIANTEGSKEHYSLCLVVSQTNYFWLILLDHITQVVCSNSSIPIFCPMAYNTMTQGGTGRWALILITQWLEQKFMLHVVISSKTEFSVN